MDQSKKDQINRDAIDYLKKFIGEVSPYFDEFFSKQKNIAESIDPIALDMVERYEDYIGGKRLRGALTNFGYELFGGKNTEDILRISSIVEFIHAFALMHDDIYDQDHIRRKKPAMHKQYEALFDKDYSDSTRDKELFGTSMATNLGDIGSYYANMILIDTNFKAEQKLQFLKRLSEIVIQTVYGQAMDITFELENLPNEEKVMKIHKFKTAYYTVAGPLQYGALLAGVSEDDPRYLALEKFGVPVGTAFQLRDDELGMFSNPEKFGKPIYSDLRQGKNTVLFAKAFELADEEQLRVLKNAYGNPNVGQDDLDEVNKILVDTGALDYSQEISWKLVNEGKEYIPGITKNKEHKKILELVADFVVTRDK